MASDEQKKRRLDELYAFVRGEDYRLFADICAFAGTIELIGEPVAIRAEIEKFGMDIAKRCLL